MKWHKTSEKLPEAYRDVLAINFCADGTLEHHIAYYSSLFNMWTTRNSWIINGVVWWAELDVPDELKS